MNKVGSAAKVKLNSFDDLFGTEQPQAGIEQVQEIALSELHTKDARTADTSQFWNCREHWSVGT